MIVQSSHLMPYLEWERIKSFGGNVKVIHATTLAKCGEMMISRTVNHLNAI